MKFPFKILLKNGGTESLDKNSYVAAGGEGTILQKGSVAYKIYHDPNKMIPVSKIQELQVLKTLPNVLGPQDIILDPHSKNPIGFTMRYIQDTEFICRLFNKNFRTDNDITPDMIVELVKNLQKTLTEIHKNRILVVDFNEMNFLTDKKTYLTPIYIDVDSYQTSTHKATAIMESIRDRQVKNNQWTEVSDWYSFGIVAFQLYMGIHPYKGTHPKYSPKEWLKRIQDNISVFNKDVTLPASCQDYTKVIPKPHLDWFKRVFEGKERSVPPMPDQTIVVALMKPQLIVGNNQFEISLIKDFGEIIKSVYFFSGVRYTLTDKAIYEGSHEIYKFITKAKKIGLTEVFKGKPLIVSLEGSSVTFKDLNDKEVRELKSTEAMEYGGKFYAVSNGDLFENSFIRGVNDKIIHGTTKVCQVFQPTTRLFRGVGVQDVLGSCWLAIPYMPGRCANLNIKELNGLRIIEARHMKGICIVITESSGVYDRYTICFDKDFKGYTFRCDKDIDLEPINFTVLANGICVSVVDKGKVEVFKDNTKIKVLDKSPIEPSMRIINDGVGVYFINGTKLYSVKLK